MFFHLCVYFFIKEDVFMQAFLLILSLAIIVEALVQSAKTVITMLENKQ